MPVSKGTTGLYKTHHCKCNIITYQLFILHIYPFMEIYPIYVGFFSKKQYFNVTVVSDRSYDSDF